MNPILLQNLQKLMPGCIIEESEKDPITLRIALDGVLVVNQYSRQLLSQDSDIVAEFIAHDTRHMRDVFLRTHKNSPPTACKT